MPKSKNRKDHAKKLQARRNRINQTTNIKKNQMKAWLDNMRTQILTQQQLQENAPVAENGNVVENVIDVTSIEPDPIVGQSGTL